MTKATRFDVGEINQVERSDEGFVTVKGIPTRTGVFPYRNRNGSMRYELRHPDDVLDPNSLKTLGTKPMTIEHPSSLVNPGNWQDEAVGMSGHRVEVLNDGLIEVVIAVQRQDAIEEIESGRKRFLSAGYRCDVSEEEGTYQGQRYTHRQRRIRYNHIALTDSPRAGALAKLRMDSADIGVQVDDENSECEWASDFVNTNHNDSEIPLTVLDSPTTPMATITIAGATFECSETLAAVVSPQLQRLDTVEAELREIKSTRQDAQDELEDLQARLDTAIAERDRHEGRAFGLEAQVEELETELEEAQANRTDSSADGISEDEIQKRVAQEVSIRVDAITDAQAILSELELAGSKIEVRFDSGMSPLQVQKALVSALNPGEAIEDDEVKGMYRAIKSGRVRGDAAASFHADALEKGVDSAMPFDKKKKGKKAPPPEFGEEEDFDPKQKRIDNCKSKLSMSKG